MAVKQDQMATQATGQISKQYRARTMNHLTSKQSSWTEQGYSTKNDLPTVVLILSKISPLKKNYTILKDETDTF